VSGDLLLSLEQLDITLSIEFLDRTKPFLGGVGGGPNSDAALEAIQQHHIFLVDGGAELRKMQEFHTKVKQGTNSFL
jgi:hypothetical protein